MKKRTIRLLRGGLWLLLCVALTLCALSLRSEAPPREDVDAASRMLVSSSLRRGQHLPDRQLLSQRGSGGAAPAGAAGAAPGNAPGADGVSR